MQKMKRSPLLKNVMTPFPYAVALGAPMIDGRKLMLEHRVHHLPVVEGHDLVGIVSDRDIKLVLGPEFDYPDPRELTISDVYVDDPYVVDINAPLRDVLSTMAKKHIGATIVTRKGQLAGIFTVTDACRAFAELLGAGDPIPDEVA